MAPSQRSSEETLCETCGIRRYAEAHPQSAAARIWRWHTTWCPGWKAYQIEKAKLTEGERAR